MAIRVGQSWALTSPSTLLAETNFNEAGAKKKVALVMVHSREDRPLLGGWLEVRLAYIPTGPFARASAIIHISS